MQYERLWQLACVLVLVSKTFDDDDDDDDDNNNNNIQRKHHHSIRFDSVWYGMVVSISLRVSTSSSTVTGSSYWYV